MTVRKPAFSFKLDPIQISSEEILADLLYPAPKAPKATPKQAGRRDRVRN
jgi:hypothetical protein